MALDREREAFVAARRFGLGARPGEVASYRADPRAAVIAELDPISALLEDPRLPSSAAAFRTTWTYLAEEARLRRAPPPQVGAAAPQTIAPPLVALEKVTPKTVTAREATQKPPIVKVPPSPIEAIFRDELVARLNRQVATATPFVERLVNFWSNHFCISASKNAHVKAAAGAYEREVIRPHVLGRFHDMLLASAQHPAMLYYLDNSASTGPTSPSGLRTKRGLNENLGREILELHTLGVDGGYDQADVTAFATALTGWSFSDMKAKTAEPGTFSFFAERHSPGSVRILGRNYPQTGVDQAERALADFARHPATARHIARKLVRHFVGDVTPPGLANRLAAVFRETDGDLRAITVALVEADEAWSAPPIKVLSPWELLVATGRMLGIDWNFGEANRMLFLFGQPLWNVPFPAGWPDEDETWAAPASLLELLDAVSALARRNAGDRNVPRLAEETLGPFLRARTRQTIERAETRDTALALLVMSPDFLRR